MVLKVDLYNLKGEKEGKITLPKEIFGVEVNRPLLAQAVRVHLANQRTARAKAKNRAEVRGSNRKIYRQKGMGRARHGDNKAPIFVGGGKAHPPHGLKRRLALNKKMRLLSLKSALSAKLINKQILLVVSFKGMKAKTKTANKILNKLGLEDKKVTIYLPEKSQKAILALRNIPAVNLAEVTSINTYQVLNGGVLVFTKEGIKKLSLKFKSRGSKPK